MKKGQHQQPVQMVKYQAIAIVTVPHVVQTTSVGAYLVQGLASHNNFLFSLFFKTLIYYKKQDYNMTVSLQAETILKIGFIIGLLFLLGYLVVKLMILDETITIMTSINKSFI